MWADLLIELREAARLAVVVLGLSILAIALAVALVGYT